MRTVAPVTPNLPTSRYGPAGAAYVPTVSVGMYAPLGGASRHRVHGQG